MPIYQYKCDECGTQSDYLVRKVGAKPSGGCKECHSDDLSRVWAGQTIALVKKETVVTPAGQVKEVGEGVDSLDNRLGGTEKLEPGIHITTGIAKDGREAINVSRVQDNGDVDASVTGYR